MRDQAISVTSGWRSERQRQYGHGGSASVAGSPSDGWRWRLCIRDERRKHRRNSGTFFEATTLRQQKRRRARRVSLAEWRQLVTDGKGSSVAVGRERRLLVDRSPRG